MAVTAQLSGLLAGLHLVRKRHADMDVGNRAMHLFRTNNSRITQEQLSRSIVTRE